MSVGIHLGGIRTSVNLIVVLIGELLMGFGGSFLSERSIEQKKKIFPSSRKRFQLKVLPHYLCHPINASVALIVAKCTS